MQSFYSTARKILPIAICCIFSMPNLGCNSKEWQGKINKAELQETLKIGDSIHLSELIRNSSSGTICALYPYQPSVADSMPHSAQINAHLTASNYSADESHWALVVVVNNSVVITRFKRSENLDILAAHEIKAFHEENLPEGFTPVNCAAMTHASIAKIESRNRIFLVLGEIK